MIEGGLWSADCLGHQWDENRATETETYRCSSKLPKSTPRSLPITLN